jgi:hypothetical protein
MALIALIMYVHTAAKRREAVEFALFALAVVLVVSGSLLAVKMAGDVLPREGVQLARLR